jgi:hypothetical protein
METQIISTIQLTKVNVSSYVVNTIGSQQEVLAT